MFKRTKNFINNFKEAYKDTMDVDPEEKQEQISMRNEIMGEYSDEIRTFVKMGGIGLGILTFGIVLVILMRPLITGKVDDLYSGTPNGGNSTNITQNIDCTKPYDATYKGNYSINGVNYSEEFAVLSDYYYSRTINGGEADEGIYALTDNQISIVTYSGESLNYTISSDCKSVSRVENGTNVVLNME